MSRDQYAGIRKTNRKRVSFNPYAGVEWSLFGRYKANLHGHTRLHKVDRDGHVIYAGETGYTESDGERRGTFGWKGEKVDVAFKRYRDLGYSIVAFTDHTLRPEQPRGSEYTIPTLEAYGIDIDSLNMLFIEGKEISHIVLPDGSRPDSHHFLSYLNDMGENENRSLSEHLVEVNKNLGFGAMAHPAPYQLDFAFYADLFRDFPFMLMEAFNPNNGGPENTTIWDRFLIRTAPEKIILAMANDDSYHIHDMGKAWNTLLMPRFDIGSFRDSFLAGRFYFSVDINANTLEKHNPCATPAIDNIQTTEQHIIIHARNCDAIRWISAGTVVHTGEALDLSHGDLKHYVRAELTGKGRTYTQPFGLM